MPQTKQSQELMAGKRAFAEVHQYYVQLQVNQQEFLETDYHRKASQHNSLKFVPL
jgi:hypothetical protein